MSRDNYNTGLLVNPVLPFKSFLEVKDSAFDTLTKKSIFNKVTKLPYYYGEVDRDNLPPTGMFSNLEKEDWVVRAIEKCVDNYTTGLRLYRAYVNLFIPGELPYYHIDNSHGITVLYYANDTFDLDQGGETSFIINDEITGILPLPGRVVIFSADIPHRANSFRDRHRFTVALKYE